MRPFDAIDHGANSESDNRERRPSSSSSLGGNSEGRDAFHDEIPCADNNNAPPTANDRAQDTSWSLQELNANMVGPAVDDRQVIAIYSSYGVISMQI
jgi:hypothetical protein